MRGAQTQRLYTEEHGDGEPLLLVEGLGQSMWAWRDQISVFARHYRTIAFDTRGTGRSVVPAEPYGIDELAQDAAEILDGRTADVVGLSMGGYVALTLALSRPDLVRSLLRLGSDEGSAAALTAFPVRRTCAMPTQRRSACHSTNTDGR